ncbi:sensor histidine kinase [Reticulibacter mediterranei]|uniref:sensor histidine kinase n=1 Tax=Reticulibacter mediterranei TaxID=2778369 RepID=UPI001C688CED|nr:ATP-binding protein [Reticulibacter mediterranei]
MPDEHSLFMSGQKHIHATNAIRENNLLHELAHLLTSSSDLAHILQLFVRHAAEACDVERCAIWLLDESRALFLPSTYHFAQGNLSPKQFQAADYIWHRTALPFDDPIISQLLQHEQGMLSLADLQTSGSQHLRAVAKKFFVCSVLLIALIREGRPVGILTLDNPGRAASFSSEQQQLARTIAQHATLAIHNAYLSQEAHRERERARRLITRAQSLYTIAMAVNSNKDLPSILEIATQHLARGLNVEQACIALLEADQLSIISSNQHISPESNFSPPLTNLPRSLHAAIQGTPLFVPQQQTQGEEKRWFESLGLHHVMIMPLMAGEHTEAEKRHGNDQHRQHIPATEHAGHIHCVGFAFIDYPKKMRSPSQGHYAFAQDIATQCALAVEKARILAEAEQAVALATERANTLDAVFNAMTEGIIVLDMEGRIAINNNTATHFLGLPPDMRPPTIQLATFLQHQPIHSLRGQRIPPSDFPLARALRGEHVRGEYFVTRRADGTERAVEVNVEPLFDGEARQIGIVGAFRDATEQVRVDQRIRGALDTMLHAAEAVSGLTDTKEISHHVLTMSLKTLNCERGMVLLFDRDTQTFTPLLSLGFTEETKEQWLAEQAIWLAPDEGQYTSFRDQLLGGHVTLINAEQCLEQPNPFQTTMILAAPIIHNHNLQGLMLLDRSARLRKEKQPGGTRLLVNPAFNIWDMAVAEGIAQFAGLAIEQARWQQEVEIARMNAETMRRSNALKDEFLAITAHEFRTPLTVILAHSQMMGRILSRTEQIDPIVREKFHESITSIDVQTHQLTNIVNTFLEVTHLNRGQIALKLEAINLEDIVKQAVATHAATSSLHQISYAIEPYEHPYLVMGDKARLLQIFANLLQNAIKYSSHGGPINVILTQYTPSEDKPMIEVRVKDTGIGIPPDAQGRLFERFYRAPNTEGSNVRGVGLGLYVVAEFLRLHGGTIRVESTGIPGEGSCFIFTLPLIKQ